MESAPRSLSTCYAASRRSAAVEEDGLGVARVAGGALKAVGGGACGAGRQVPRADGPAPSIAACGDLVVVPDVGDPERAAVADRQVFGVEGAGVVRDRG